MANGIKLYLMKSKIFSGITFGVIILFVAVLLISPSAKALILSGLNKIGLMPKPEIGVSVSSPEGNNNDEITPEVILAPSILFKDGNGNTVDISKQKGKVLFINFWATWCPPCIAEMPSIHKLRSQLNNKDILFLMVDVDNDYKKSSKFMANNKYNLPVYTPASSIPSNFLSGSIPTTVIIDKTGKMVGRHEGGADYTHPEIVQFLKDLAN